MLIVKSIDIRNNFKSWCEKVVNGETVVISRPRNENVYIIGEKEYNELKKAKEKAEYLTMLNESLKQLEEKETIKSNITLSNYVPNDYVKDDSLKILIHTKINSITTREEFNLIKEKTNIHKLRYINKVEVK